MSHFFRRRAALCALAVAAVCVVAVAAQNRINIPFEQYVLPNGLTVIHSIDRQRYYEALRGEHGALLSMYLEAVETSAKSELQVYDEAEKARPRRRRA